MAHDGAGEGTVWNHSSAKTGRTLQGPAPAQIPLPLVRDRVDQGSRIEPHRVRRREAGLPLRLVAGPPRLSLADRGITFATSTRQGVCITFREQVSALAPFMKHPALTVTVDEPERLAELLTSK